MVKGAGLSGSRFGLGLALALKLAPRRCLMFGRLANSRYLDGSEKPGAEINTIRQERQHVEQGDKQANAAEYANYL